MVKQKNKKFTQSKLAKQFDGARKPAILGARNSQRAKTHVIIVALFLIALFSSILFGSFNAKAAVPTITSLSTTTGRVGTTVFISGSSFDAPQGGSTVTFGGVDAGMVTSWSDTLIQVKVPLGTPTGAVSVKVTVGSDSNPKTFYNKGMITGGGMGHSLVLKNNGTVWASGYDGAGQLGDGANGQVGPDYTDADKNTPVQSLGLTDAVFIASGANHSLAIRNNGTVRAWGVNNWGQLGNGGVGLLSAVPIQVSVLTNAVSVAGGMDHSLALQDDGSVWAWGKNTDGELGDGTNNPRNVPTPVLALASDVVAIASGDNHSLALKNNGTVWAWGSNNKGQLGDGSTTDSSVPLQVPGLTNVVAIAGGGNHFSGGDSSFSLALKSDGTVWAWGGNSNGQLGDGTIIDRSSPVLVSGLTNVVAIAGGGLHSIALKNDGTVRSWGSNLVGQLGDGTTNDSHVPIQVSGLTNVVSIAGGFAYSLVLKNDGTVWAWGNDSFGQLADGANGYTNSIPLNSRLSMLPPNLPRIWYNHNTGHYVADIAALEYVTAAVPHDVGIYRYTGNGQYPPDVITPPETVAYSGCSFIIKTVDSVGVYICDAYGQNYGGSVEPLEIDPNNLGGSNLDVDGIQNIDAIAITSYDGDHDIYTHRTILAAHSNVNDILLYLGSTYPYNLSTTVVDTIPSVFVANGAGKDYSPFNVSALPAGVVLWGGDGIGGARDNHSPTEAITSVGDGGTLAAATTNGGSGNVDLSWNAIADYDRNGNPIQATSYDIRYSTSDIDPNEPAFDDATPYAQIMIPKISGGGEAIKVRGLAAGTLYYFSVRACGKYMNCSPVGVAASAVSSNSALKLPEIWYDTRTRHYKTDVMSLEYDATMGVYEGAYRYMGDVDMTPGTIFQSCSIFAKNSFGPSPPGSVGTVCDVEIPGDAYGEPTELFDGPASSDFGFTGADGENIDVLVVTIDFSGPTYPLWTVLTESSNTETVKTAIHTVIDPVLPPGGSLVIDTNANVFTGHGFGKDYTRNALLAGVTWWGGDGIGGTRDSTAPDPITISDAETGTATGKVDLTWTAKGDDGAVGTAYSYIVKYLDTSITNANFDSAPTFVQTWAPATSGTVENFTVDGLTPGSTYYFSVKACDKFNNCSDFGNTTIGIKASLPPPAFVPHTPVLAIDNGGATTSNRLVDLLITGNDPSATQIALSRLSDFSDFDIQNLQPLSWISQNKWDLCAVGDPCNNGSKTVYARLYDDSGTMVHDTFSSSIELSRPTTVSINSGASSTDNQSVTLSVSNFNGNASFIKISNLADLSDADFQTYSATVSGWDLCRGISPCANGAKSVYVQLYNSDKQSISGIILSSINLNLPAEVPVPVIPEPVIPQPETNPVPVPSQPGETNPTPTTPGTGGQTSVPGTQEPQEPANIPEPVEPSEPTPTPAPQNSGSLQVAIQSIETFAKTEGTPVVSAVLATTAALTVVAVANSFVDLLAILRHLIILLLQFLGIKRKNKNWGIVYDSSTKEPLSLCIVRLFNAKTNILSQTVVTDMKGRFGLIPEVGSYYITVTKPLFSFPSRSLKGIAYDVGYSSLYFGGKKFLSGKSIINFAVPLDKPNVRNKSRKLLIAVRSFLISLSTPFAVLGALLSLVISVINPTVINYVVFAFYILILLFKKLFTSPPKKPAVKIFDYQTRKPMPKLAIEIFSKKYSKLVATKFSDEKGKFDLFLPDGEYFLKTSMGKYDFVSGKKLKNSYNGGTLVVGSDKPFSGINLYLKKKGKI